MSGSTISTHVTISVTVGSPGYYSPLTILPVTFSGGPPTGGFISPTAGVGVYSDLINASIMNQGRIYGAFAPQHSAGTGANGVDLFGGGTLTNQGTIRGGGASIGAIGVSIASSTLFNDGTGTIRGGEYNGTGLVASACLYFPMRARNHRRLRVRQHLRHRGHPDCQHPDQHGLHLRRRDRFRQGVRLYSASKLVNSGHSRRPRQRLGAIYVASGSVTNAAAGTIGANQYSGQGVDLASGATLDNQGFIGLPGNYVVEGSVGGSGVLLPAGAVLSNTGTIDGIGSATTSAERRRRRGGRR